MTKRKLDWDKVRNEDLIKLRGSEYLKNTKHSKDEITNVIITRILVRELNRNLRNRKNEHKLNQVKNEFVEELKYFNYCFYCKAPIKTLSKNLLKNKNNSVGKIKPHFEYRLDKNTNKFFSVFVDGQKAGLNYFPEISIRELTIIVSCNLPYLFAVACFITYFRYQANKGIFHLTYIPGEFRGYKIDQWFILAFNTRLLIKYTPPEFYLLDV